MSETYFCVSWDSKNLISKGFSRLQQNGEFVDMTLAADGYLVKVHQNIVALASPYIKAMIQSASCQHPVVFLNNISHETLSFILEYIYTGEVKIPTEVISEFIETCKALRIPGVEDFDLPTMKNSSQSLEQLEPTIERSTEPPDNNNFAAHITINSENFNVEVTPLANNVTHTITNAIIPVENEKIENIFQSATVTNEDSMIQETTLPIAISVGDKEMQFEPVLDNVEENNTNIPTNPDTGKRKQQTKKITVPPSMVAKDKIQHYSISNRGSLQLLLNRYIYHCHHQSCGGRKRRWRCIDYRKLNCRAFIDTDDDHIIQRSEVHTHSSHDAKILRKFKSKSVFTSLIQAEDRVTTLKGTPPKVNRSRKYTISKNERLLFGKIRNE